jgi:hypothetical protein
MRRYILEDTNLQNLRICPFSYVPSPNKGEVGGRRGEEEVTTIFKPLQEQLLVLV